MRSLMALALLLATVAHGQTDGGNHGDPYNKRWRAEKLKTRQILSSMKVEFLLPTASPEARAELSKKGPNGESMFQLMEKDLAASEIIFRKKGESNPDKTCAQTDLKPASPIYISEVDCGKITPREMWETLLGDTAHHFGHNDELSDYIALAIMESYLYRAGTDPAVGIKPRYEGIYNGKRVMMTFDPESRRVRFEGLDRDFSSLPPLNADGLGFSSSGRHGSFTCEISGIGENSKGQLEYGVLERYPIYLDATLTITPRDNLNTIRVSISFEKSSGKKCEKAWDSLSFSMNYLPPSPEEMEKQRLDENAQIVFKAIQDKDWTLAESALRQGIPLPRYAEALTKAMAANAWNVVEAAAESLPENTKLPFLLFTLLDSKDAAKLERALSNEKLKRHFNFSEKRNYYTPVGYVLTLRHQFPSTLEFNEFASKVLDLLFEAGADAKAVMTDISNVPRTPLSHAVGRHYPSLAVTESILKHMTPEDVREVDARDRTSVDYLLLYWNVYKTTCKSMAESNPKAKQKYDQVLAEFSAVYEALKAKGHDGQRRGCLYYRNPGCTYDSKDGLKYGFATDFKTTADSSLWICG